MDLNTWATLRLDYQSRCSRLGAMAKNRAKTSGLDFDLTSDCLIKLWEEQEGRCAVSNRVFDLSKPENETVKANAPSLDRINPKEGYIKGNVRFVCYQVNTALNEYGKDALISLCKDIISFNGGIIK